MRAARSPDRTQTTAGAISHRRPDRTYSKHRRGANQTADRARDRFGDPYSGGPLSKAPRGEQNATVDELPAGVRGQTLATLHKLSDQFHRARSAQAVGRADASEGIIQRRVELRCPLASLQLRGEGPHDGINPQPKIMVGGDETGRRYVERVAE